jgi:hypothetical protein
MVSHRIFIEVHADQCMFSNGIRLLVGIGKGRSKDGYFLKFQLLHLKFTAKVRVRHHVIWMALLMFAQSISRQRSISNAKVVCIGFLVLQLLLLKTDFNRFRYNAFALCGYAVKTVTGIGILIILRLIWLSSGWLLCSH